MYCLVLNKAKSKRELLFQQYKCASLVHWAILRELMKSEKKVACDWQNCWKLETHNKSY